MELFLPLGRTVGAGCEPERRIPILTKRACDEGLPAAVAISSKKPTVEEKRFARRVVRALSVDYPDAHCSLRFDTPLQLLVATILSAQCTDERVNLVTEDLFASYPTAFDLAAASIRTLEKAVRSTGFFRNKAKNIKACCQMLVEEYDGLVPRTMEELVPLPGVGRKTANVVLGNAYGIASGVVVDTHVTRICGRLGLVATKDAVKIEKKLNDLLPRKEWIDFSHRCIQHGRRVCVARTKPRCEECRMRSFCPQVDVD